MTDEEDQRLIQGIIPDMVIDARAKFLAASTEKLSRTTLWTIA